MTKLISISDEAYEQLYHLKHKGDSFTKVILRFTEKEKRRPLTDFWGALPEESVNAMEKVIGEGRLIHQKARLQRLKNAS